MCVQEDLCVCRCVMSARVSFTHRNVCLSVRVSAGTAVCVCVCLCLCVCVCVCVCLQEDVYVCLCDACKGTLCVGMCV